MRRSLLSREVNGATASAISMAPATASRGLNVSELHGAPKAEAGHDANQVVAGGQGKVEWSLANALMGAPLQRKCACGGSAEGEGECEECRKEDAGKALAGKETLQRQAANQAASKGVPPIVHEVLRSPGRSLDPAARAYFESRFGHDFGRVRIHADDRAADSAKAVNARAYTVGRHVVFDQGRYAPQSAPGRRLLAHELSHVLQQQKAGIAPDAEARRIGESGNALEREADQAAEDVLNGSRTEPLSPASSGIQRDDRGKEEGKPPAKPSCGTPELFTELDMSWPIPNNYFRGSTPLEEGIWKKQLGAASSGKCVAKGAFKGVKLSWDLGNPRLGKVLGVVGLNKNDVKFDINVHAVYAGKPCCSCFAGSASWSFNVQITRGTETGKTKSPITGSKSAESCKGDECCAINQDMTISTTSGFKDVTATVDGNVKVSGSAFR